MVPQRGTSHARRHNVTLELSGERRLPRQWPPTDAPSLECGAVAQCVELTRIRPLNIPPHAVALAFPSCRPRPSWRSPCVWCAVAPCYPLTIASNHVLAQRRRTVARRRGGAVTAELYFLVGSHDHGVRSPRTARHDVGTAQPPFDARFLMATGAFDVTADGQRFPVSTLVTSPRSPVTALN